MRRRLTAEARPDSSSRLRRTPPLRNFTLRAIARRASPSKLLRPLNFRKLEGDAWPVDYCRPNSPTRETISRWARSFSR
jgi:hypothetical protein